jgi:hypothetical protein
MICACCVTTPSSAARPAAVSGLQKCALAADSDADGATPSADAKDSSGTR